MIEELQRMGIECRLIGKRKMAVDALPAFLEPDDFSAFLNAWREGKKLDAAAVRYARGARRKFSIEEAVMLWRQLQKCREPLYDPLGRRIYDKLDAERLKKIMEGA
jgi:DNA mismatch repair ATPase MutL